jgi:hypothetical protein
MYEELAGQAKLHLLQCIVSSIVLEMACDPLFVGLPEDLHSQLRETEKQLKSLSRSSVIQKHTRATNSSRPLQYLKRLSTSGEQPH